MVFQEIWCRQYTNTAWCFTRNTNRLVTRDQINASVCRKPPRSKDQAKFTPVKQWKHGELSSASPSTAFSTTTCRGSSWRLRCISRRGRRRWPPSRRSWLSWGIIWLPLSRLALWWAWSKRNMIFLTVAQVHYARHNHWLHLASLPKVPVFKYQKMALRAPKSKNGLQKSRETPPKMVG